jgi:hypothetical protein
MTPPTYRLHVSTGVRVAAGSSLSAPASRTGICSGPGCIPARRDRWCSITYGRTKDSRTGVLSAGTGKPAARSGLDGQPIPWL